MSGEATHSASRTPTPREISGISGFSGRIDANGDFCRPAPCHHAQHFRRPTGVLVCLACAATLAPGAPVWRPQVIAYCPEGQHVPYVDTPRQCARCPYVSPITEASVPNVPWEVI
jgi:hypothetical protein